MSRDLKSAEDLSTPQSKIYNQIQAMRAVTLSDAGNWVESCKIFEEVIQRGQKNALPWWLRYSMSLLETNRGIEAVQFLQRVTSSFPEEAECKAFAAALYTSQGAPEEGAKYWSKLLPEEQEKYKNLVFIKKLKWGPVATANYQKFVDSLIDMKVSTVGSLKVADGINEDAGD